MKEIDVDEESGNMSSSNDLSADNQNTDSDQKSDSSTKPKWVKKPKTLSKKDQRKMQKVKSTIADATSTSVFSTQAKGETVFSSVSNISNSSNGKSADELLGLKVGGIFI